MARRPERGFTVIEVVVVLLIVMILAGMVVPAVTAGVRMSKLREAASQTATAFRRTRSMAITAGEIYCVYINQVSNFAELRDRPASVHIHPAQDLNPPANPVSAGGVMLPKGVNFVGGATELSWIFFMPDGSVALSSGVTWEPVKLVYFKPGASTPEPGRFEITVRPLTGRIEVSERKD